MEEQNGATSRPDLPLPVLTGPPLTPQGPREWKQAPGGVRDARVVDILGIIGCAIGSVATIVEASDRGDTAGSGAPSASVAAFVLLAIYAGIIALLVWLLRSLKRGVPTAWNVQMAFSIVGLLGFPLGTLIHGFVLSKWFRPETKAWFGRS